MYVCAHVCIYINIDIYVCMYVCLRMCIKKYGNPHGCTTLYWVNPIYIYTHTHTSDDHRAFDHSQIPV